MHFRLASASEALDIISYRDARLVLLAPAPALPNALEDSVPWHSGRAPLTVKGRAAPTELGRVRRGAPPGSPAAYPQS